MKVDVKKLDKLKRMMTIEVPCAMLAGEKEAAYKELNKKLKVPGFRPGAAPIDVLQKYHGPALQEEFLRKVVPDCYAKALKEQSIEPVSAPRIYDVSLSEEALSFRAEFEVKPQLDINESDYKGLAIKTKPVKAEAIEIEKMLTQLKDSVKKITKTDYDDERLARWTGYPDSGALREAISTQLCADKLKARRNEIENTVAEALLAKVKIEAPGSLIEEQFQKLYRQEVYSLQVRGVSEKDLTKYDDDIRKKLKPLAERQVKLYYILDAVARKESLDAEMPNLFEGVMGFILSHAEYSK